MADQVATAQAKAQASGQGSDDDALNALLRGADTWTID